MQTSSFNVVYSSPIFSFQITVKGGVEWVGCKWLISFVEPYEGPDPANNCPCTSLWA